MFALLVLACFGAIFLTQRLKHTPTAVQEIRFDSSFAPTAAAGGPTQAISFRTAHNDEVVVRVTDGAGDVVATIVAGYPVHRYRHLHLYWNGHTGPCAAPASPACAGSMTGPLAAPGSYRLRITLVHERRTVDSASSFRLLAPAAGSAG